MLYEYARYKGYDVTKAADLSGFADQGSVSAFAVGPMQWAVAHELIFGVGGNAIAPQATATRAQLAAVLHRFCEAFAGADGADFRSRHRDASIRMRPCFCAMRRKTCIFQTNF